MLNIQVTGSISFPIFHPTMHTQWEGLNTTVTTPWTDCAGYWLHDASRGRYIPESWKMPEPPIMAIYTVVHKKEDTKLLSITSPNNDRFSKFFHWYTQQVICKKSRKFAKGQIITDSAIA